MRVVSAVLAFLFCGFMVGIVFLLLGDVTGWLTVHGETRGPAWWRMAYFGIVLVGTPMISLVCARAAWRSGAR